MPVSFSYSAASFWEKKSSNGLMNELSLATVSDLVAALARRGASTAAAPPARAVVRNSRRVLMEPPLRFAGLARKGSLRRGQNAGNARADPRRTSWIDEDQALAPSVPPKDHRSGVCGTVGPVVRPVKAAMCLTRRVTEARVDASQRVLPKGAPQRRPRDQTSATGIHRGRPGAVSHGGSHGEGPHPRGVLPDAAVPSEGRHSGPAPSGTRPPARRAGRHVRSRRGAGARAAVARE